MIFKGDIIITDPLYLIKEDRKGIQRHHPTYPRWKDFHLDFDGKTIIKDYSPFLKSKEGKEYRSLFNANSQAMREAEMEWQKNNPNLCQDDWQKCKFGKDMSQIDLNAYITRSNDYGKWNCITYLESPERAIGSFCGDSGMVGVFLLDEVLKYNPDFNFHLVRPWTTTWIKDFYGDIFFFGTVYDKYLSVVGKGNVNFHTKQNFGG